MHHAQVANHCVDWHVAEQGTPNRLMLQKVRWHSFTGQLVVANQRCRFFHGDFHVVDDCPSIDLLGVLIPGLN